MGSVNGQREDEAVGEACVVILRYLGKQVAAELAAQTRVEQPPALPAPYALRMAEVAELTGLSEREVQRQVVSGKLASLRVGRVRLIPRSAVEAFICEGTAENDAWLTRK